MASRSVRNNNPGNIRHHGPDGTIYAVVKAFNGEDDGSNYAHFPSVASGCGSLTALIAKVYNNYTVTDLIKRYAPSGDSNDPEKYAKVIMQMADISENKTISELNPFEFFDLCKAITKFEGWIK